VYLRYANYNLKTVIAYVEGKIAQLEPTHAIIDVGGMGYQVKISVNTYTRIRDKKQTRLHTYFQVREDAQVLYGFDQLQEKQLFEQLISISGVGGNTAIVILSSISPQDLYSAITTGDAFALKQVKGIGAKTAGRIILELKDKISLEGADAGSLGAGKTAAQGSQKAEALAALAQLGLSKSEANKRLEKVIKGHGGALSVEEMIKLALRNA
jgi:Holliday junction DNA helicase RuvA